MADTTRPRVLFIAYTFPPIGGSGVQRTTKFVKYLPQHGWDCSVLTVAGGSVPLWDRSLERDVPKETVIARARTWEPRYAVKASVSGRPNRSSGLLTRARAGLLNVAKSLLQPDAQVLWAPAAAKAGLQLLRSRRHDAIVATAPPFSSLLIGAWLSDRTGVPLVLDYRDEWTLSNVHYENRQPSEITKRLQRAMEHWALRRADLVVATTVASAKSLGGSIKDAGGAADAVCVYNGYDPEDFSSLPTQSRSGLRLRLVYVGTLWSLMSLEPLVDALEKLAANSPALLDRLELVLAGRRTVEQETLVARIRKLPCALVLHDYVDHRTALTLLTSADALCLLLADREGADRWVPAKTFEYLVAGRPLLALVPPGELRIILQRHTPAIVIEPDDRRKLVSWFKRALESHRPGVSRPYDPYAGLEFDRRAQAARLGELLAQLRCPSPKHVGGHVIADMRLGT